MTNVNQIHKYGKKRKCEKVIENPYSYKQNRRKAILHLSATHPTFDEDEDEDVTVLSSAFEKLGRVAERRIKPLKTKVIDFVPVQVQINLIKSKAKKTSTKVENRLSV